eukprot:scaffold1348_cov130-Isochrysis_galbana.AAC.5
MDAGCGGDRSGHWSYLLEVLGGLGGVGAAGSRRRSRRGCVRRRGKRHWWGGQGIRWGRCGRRRHRLEDVKWREEAEAMADIVE